MEYLQEEVQKTPQLQIKLSQKGDLHINGEVDSEQLRQLIDAAQFRVSCVKNLEEIYRKDNQVLGAIATFLLLFLMFGLSFSTIILIKQYVSTTFHQQRTYP